jgi:hypothetical protein
MWILGAETDQRELAHVMGKPYWIAYAGSDEHELRRAASQYGIETRYLQMAQREDGALFARELRAHLEKGLPAVLVVQDFGHWIVVVAWDAPSEKFIVVDHFANGVYGEWSEAHLARQSWCEDEDGVEPSQRFALLLSRADGKPAFWRIDREFLSFCARGSDDYASVMRADLIEMVARSCPSGAASDRSEEPLETLLERHRDAIVGSVSHWVSPEHAEASARDIAAFYGDYARIARAARLSAPAALDPVLFAAQMSSLLTTYAWHGEV